MSISAISTSATTTTTSTSSTTSNLTTDTTAFLNLLLTQLQNQNPLDPTDTNEFVNQLISYAGIEQQQSMNDSLTEMLTSFNSLVSSNAIGYIGHTVEAYGDTTSLANGEATWGYSLNSDAEDVSISIKDSDGNTVWEGAGETESGKHTFTWDGTSTDGTKLPDGEYTIEVTATDSAGDSVYGTTTIVGEVDGVDSSSGKTLLNIGSVTVAFDTVIGIRA